MIPANSTAMKPPPTTTKTLRQVGQGRRPRWMKWRPRSWGSGIVGQPPVATMIRSVVTVSLPTRIVAVHDLRRGPRPELHTGIVEQAAVDAVQAADFRVLVGDQAVPLEAVGSHVPAETCRILEILRGEVAGEGPSASSARSRH